MQSKKKAEFRPKWKTKHQMHYKNKSKEKPEEHYEAQISDSQIILKEIPCLLCLNTWFYSKRIYVALAPYD